ncbi:MAG: metal ABC transporter permease [Bacteroidota bacterium]
MEHIFSLPSTMLWPLAACLVLTGILAYFGVHIIAREVIFVDLALAQIAALGTITGVLLGYEVGKDSNMLYLYSLAFTFLGALIFSMTKMREKKVPHEAIIGIVYAVAFAATILVLAGSPLGPHELDRIIKGELLWVHGEIILKTAILYAIIGAFHFFYRGKFILISFKPGQAEASGLNVRLWDFLFYISFGFVITSSVAIAGVFLVFSYLMIPAVGAMLFSDRLGVRLAIGWISGSIISFIGIKLSWETGLPTSPLIVVLLAIGLILAAVGRYIKTAPSKSRALLKTAMTTGLTAIFVVGLFLLGKKHEDPYEHTIHMLGSKFPTDRVVAISKLNVFLDRKEEWLPLLLQRLRDEDREVRRFSIEQLVRMREHSAVPDLLPLIGDPSSDIRLEAIQALKLLGDRRTAKDFIAAAKSEEDVEIRIQLYEAALEFGDTEAIPLLIDLMAESGIFAEDAFASLQAHIEFDVWESPPARRAGIPSGKDIDHAMVKSWWLRNNDRLVWEDATRKFKLQR